MALITCPECGAQVSNHAENCPKCAYPIMRGTTQAHDEIVQTVEQTSKKLKLQLLISSLLCMGSLLVMLSSCSEPQARSDGMASGTLGFFVGLIWFMIVRFKIWWHHG